MKEFSDKCKWTTFSIIVIAAGVLLLLQEIMTVEKNRRSLEGIPLSRDSTEQEALQIVDSELISTLKETLDEKYQKACPPLDYQGSGTRLWTIMICTVTTRAHFFEPLYDELLRQISNASLCGEVEVVYLSDDGELSIGAKRNRLLQKAAGKYVNFIDDDDLVSEEYVELLYSRLRRDPDCVELKGIITENGKNPKLFIHSIEYTSFFTGADGIYYRPPNHLNPMRRTIAQKFNYKEIDFGEDSDWTMRVVRSQLLKREESVPDPYYFYRYRSKKPELRVASATNKLSNNKAKLASAAIMIVLLF